MTAHSDLAPLYSADAINVRSQTSSSIILAYSSSQSHSLSFGVNRGQFCGYIQLVMDNQRLIRCNISISSPVKCFMLTLKSHGAAVTIYRQYAPVCQ